MQKRRTRTTPPLPSLNSVSYLNRTLPPGTKKKKRWIAFPATQYVYEQLVKQNRPITIVELQRVKTEADARARWLRYLIENNLLRQFQRIFAVLMQGLKSVSSSFANILSADSILGSLDT